MFAEPQVGQGFDVHRFTSDRPLMLATLHWPGEPGLAGHSDADVVVHAVCDALLAAAGQGDLGSNFGTSDPQWAGASRARLLTRTVELVHAVGLTINNVTVTLIGNRPKLAPRRSEAEDAMSGIVGARVSLAATTTDGLGFTGRDEGLAAMATALVSPAVRA